MKKKLFGLFNVEDSAKNCFMIDDGKNIYDGKNEDEIHKTLMFFKIQAIHSKNCNINNEN